MRLSTIKKDYSSKSSLATNYPKKHMLAGLPLFTAPIPKEKKEEKTVHLNSINDINISASANNNRQLVFAGKIRKRAGESVPFSMEHLIETQQAGLI